jgi:hypothetical protein
MSESADNSGAPVKHALYKPDLVSCNFWVFLVLECALKGQKFGSEREITQTTGYIPMQNIRKWPMAYVSSGWRCKMCKACKWHYFEEETMSKPPNALDMQ